ncbi:hypothetical protein BQ8482_310007 [Mesorhizobium delmotii]|uniref:Uncharacterized protein n=1 Tax=Mesorhizobium delmotii TaxID=1631247 RepID=A0A2P9ANG8_9HYPH|nr:hypothetical protein BQ8482_310007 [Mesorhizobium delmotii]
MMLGGLRSRKCGGFAKIRPLIWRTRSNARLFDDVGLESVPIEVIDGQSLCWSAPAPLLAGAAGSSEWQVSFETAEGRADASSPPGRWGPCGSSVRLPA